jgi:hypothetical protein
MVVFALVLCACQNVNQSASNVDSLRNDDVLVHPDLHAEQLSEPITVDGKTVGCILYRTPFHELRAKSECIVLGRVVDVQSQSSTVDYVTVAVDETYRAYGEQTFETIRIHQMVSEDSLANHVGKTCLLFLKKHPAGEGDVFYGVDSMKGITLYDENTNTLFVYETSFVCRALEEWLMENVSGGETVRVVEMDEFSAE